MVEIIVNGQLVDRKGAAKWLRQDAFPEEGRKKYELVLELFWAAFPWRSCENARCAEKHRCALGCLPKAKKLEMLKAVAAINLMISNRRRRTQSVREYFNSHRDEQDDRPCWVCGKRFNHRHHIVQIQHGGANRSSNIVLLCAPCHREVHRSA